MFVESTFKELTFEKSTTFMELTFKEYILKDLEFRNKKECLPFTELIQMQQQYIIAKKREIGYQETLARLASELMDKDSDDAYELVC